MMFGLPDCGSDYIKICRVHLPNKCFCTFPNAFLGNLSTTTNRRGILKDARFCLHRSSITPASHPSASITRYATGTSPRNGVGLGTHRRFRHFRLLFQKLLDLPWINVEPARYDQVALSATERVIAIGGAGGEVAGSEEPIDKCL